jgi:hypothetical protein
VHGREVVRFTPDLPVRRLVFRLWANTPRYRRHGVRTRVTAVALRGAVSRDLRPGRRRSTLLELPLGRRVGAGSEIRAALRFRLRVPPRSGVRIGRARGAAWVGSGMPLLAWERGRGWMRDPPVAWGEATGSEDFRLRLAVVAPRSTGVVAPGRPAGGSPAAGGARVHRYRARALRDVMVAVGRFRRAHIRAARTRVTVGVAPGVANAPRAVARRVREAVRDHVRRLGPFPYPRLAVAVLPGFDGGVEYPAALMLGHFEGHPHMASHEVAHQWFYALVGNDQGRDPWLDEALAQYVEALDDGTGPDYETAPVPAAGRHRVGAPMRYWQRHRHAYIPAVYEQGAAMLLRARRAAGPARFDRALRCYVRRNAHRVARPSDFGAAFRRLPGALRIFHREGAL